jgi:phage-related tail fiber protein
MILEVANTTVVTLLVDPSVVLATRQYCDDKVAAEINKLDGKQSVRVATTVEIALAGLLTIDGVVLAAGDRVLVKDQATTKDNGIYVVAAGNWPRAADADAAIEITPGMFVSVEQGTANADSVWQLVTDAPITLGATGLVFEMVDGKTGVVAGTYRSVTVNPRGQVTGGTNPTTLAGFGITDAFTQSESKDRFGAHVTSVASGVTALTVANSGLVMVNAAGGNVTINLPAAAALGGLPISYRFVRTDSSANAVTISRAGADTIDGIASVGLHKLGRIDVVGDGISSWVSMLNGSMTASVYRSSQQSLTAGANKIIYDVVEHDNYGLWDTENKRFVAPRAGKYRISGAGIFTEATATNWYHEIYKNGAVYKRGTELIGGNANTTMTFDAIVPMVPGDYAEIYAQAGAANMYGSGANFSAYVYAQCEYLGQ